MTTPARGGDEELRYVPVYVCTDPGTYGHRSRWWSSTEGSPRLEGTDEDREAAAAERRQVLANNTAWRSAEVVRRKWLVSFCVRKTAPKGASKVVAEWLLRGERPLVAAIERGSVLARDLVGSGLDLEAASDNRAQVVGLAIVLAAYEGDTGTHSWRHPSEATARYLRYIAAQGYQLSEVERLACGDSGAEVEQ